MCPGAVTTNALQAEPAPSGRSQASPPHRQVVTPPYSPKPDPQAGVGLCQKCDDPQELSAMQPFRVYVDSVERLVALLLSSDTDPTATLLNGALNGQPSEMLRHLIGNDTRKSYGAFFSGSVLSNTLVGTFTKPLTPVSTVFDPACGAGDLLLACSRKLPIEGDLPATLHAWGSQLRGVDIFPEFIRVTKARLVLAAARRTPIMHKVGSFDLDSWFPGITVGDGLNQSPQVSQASHIVMNPPFNRLATPQDIQWSSGQVSKAAVFVDSVLSQSRNGTALAAILPDVLRSGTRYKAWRSAVAARAAINKIAIWGLFDSNADVDVFLFEAVAGADHSQKYSIWKPAPPFSDSNTFGSRVTVSVGALVPHRHQNRGRWHPYLRARGLAQWGTIHTDTLPKKRFDGTVYNPPFVVVRRTSRPGDTQRAVGTIILGDRSVAVENHLLVVRPQDSNVTTCRQILRVLQDDRTSKWLDTRIRCRHLTVQAVSEMPYWSVG